LAVPDIPPGAVGVITQKNVAGCIKTLHPCADARNLPDHAGKIGSAYNESTSIGMAVSSRNFCCGFLPDTVMDLILSMHAANRTQPALGETGRYTSVAPSNSHRRWFT
jgi:hypothetical protein